jgi:peptidyl-prolyl cis-trans isomerase SurA
MRPRTACLLAVFLLWTPVSAQIIDEMVANVNGEMISWTDLAKREEEIRRDLERRLSGQELEQALQLELESILVDMINEKLLYQRAERLGLDINLVYRRQTENFKKMNNIESNEDLKAALESQGMTLEEFRESVLRFGVPDAMISAEVRQKIIIPSSEVEAYYQENQDFFANPAVFTFREIGLLLIKSGQEDELLEQAAEIVAAARSGKDFAELVKQHSQAASADRGGLVDGLSVEDMSPIILQVLDSLEPGEVSDPVLMPRAVMVLKLLEKEAAHVASLEDSRRGIERVLWRKRMQAEMDEYFRKLWAENQIVVTPKFAARYKTDTYR